MKVARVNRNAVAITTGVGGLGGANQSPPGGVSMEDLTDVDVTGIADGDVLIWDAGSMTWIAGPVQTGIWVPVMTEDVGTGLWYVAVTGDGDAVITEVFP